MKPSMTELIALITACSLLLLAACASNKGAPDTAKIEAELAEVHHQEIELVRSTVPDIERADRLIALLSERDRLVSEYVNEIVAYREQMSALNADYHAPRASFDVLFAQFNRSRDAAQKEFIALLKTMKDETTEKEWKVLSKYQLKKLNPRDLTYGRTATGD